MTIKSTELKEGTGPVFLSEYPADDDVKGWLKIQGENPVFGKTQRLALAYIEKLERENALLTKTMRELAISVLHVIGESGAEAEEKINER